MRNVEDIRRKNMEDNQLFLQQLCMNDIRNDLKNSARALLPRKDSIKTRPSTERTEYPTRYSAKLKSGEIEPHIPQWQRDREMKVMKKEEEKLLRERRRRLAKREKRKNHRTRRFTLLYRNNTDPYQKVFKPRCTKTDQRIQEESLEKN